MIWGDLFLPIQARPDLTAAQPDHESDSESPDNEASHSIRAARTGFP